MPGRWLDKPSALLGSIRYRDAFIFQAPSLVGIAFSFHGWGPGMGGEVLVFALGSFCLMAYIFCFNDWSDLTTDSGAPGKRNAPAGDKTLSPKVLLTLSLTLCLAGLLALALISVQLLAVGLCIAGLGAVYSFPILRFKGKGIPLFSSLLHFVGTLLTFLLGYALFSPLDGRAFLLGGYFGLIITAGHLVQEVQDYEGDQAALVSTNAVRFGQTRVFGISFILFSFSFVYLFALASAELIPPLLRYLVAFYPIYAILAVRTTRAGLAHDTVHRFRGQYRILFGIIVSLMALSTLLVA